MGAWGARQGGCAWLRSSWVPTPPPTARTCSQLMADSFCSSTPMDMLAFGRKFLETSVIIKGLSFLPFPEAGLQVERGHAGKAPRSVSRPRTVGQP